LFSKPPLSPRLPPSFPTRRSSDLMFSLAPRPAVVAHVCDDIACLTRGAASLCADLERKIGPPGTTWLRSPCLGLCERAPAAMVTDRKEHTSELQSLRHLVCRLLLE